jgi:hypothetical protein
LAPSCATEDGVTEHQNAYAVPIQTQRIHATVMIKTVAILSRIILPQS